MSRVVQVYSQSDTLRLVFSEDRMVRFISTFTLGRKCAYVIDHLINGFDGVMDLWENEIGKSTDHRYGRLVFYWSDNELEPNHMMVNTINELEEEFLWCIRFRIHGNGEPIMAEAC